MRSRTTRLVLALLITAPAFAGCTFPEPGGTDFVGSGDSGPRVCPVDLVADPPLDVTGDVAQWRGDAERSGFVPGARLPAAVDVAWAVPNVNPGTHTAAKGSVVEAPNGLFLVGGDDGVLRGITQDGNVTWESRTGPSGNGIHGTPSVIGDVAFVGAYDGVLYAFNATSGDLHWCTRVGDYIGASPLVLGDRVHVMVETDVPSGRFATVDAATGTLVRMDVDVSDHPHSSLAFDPDTNLLVAGDNDGYLYAWNATTLQRAWTFGTDGAIKAPVTVFDGGAFFGSWDEHVYRVDLATGTESWRHRTDGYVMSGAGVHPESGTVFIGSHDGHVYALDADTGEEAWRYRTGRSVISSPTVLEDGLLVGSHDEHLYALTLDGELAWKWRARGIVSSSAFVTGDGRILVTERADGAAGRLVALEPAAR